MKFRTLYIIILFFLISCTQDFKIIKKIPQKNEPPYSSKGFALIYDESLFNKKILQIKLNNNQDYVLHKFLKNNRLVNITNPINSKSITTKVKNNASYPSIYNVVITKKMAEELNLDKYNPYVEIFTVKQNEKFIAKESSIFDEEKNVANKAPVTSIDINDLSVSVSKQKVKKNPLFIIDIADFYYHVSALSIKKRFENEGNLLNIQIKKISQNRFKVYSGPYDSLNSMKDTFFILNELGFDELNIVDINK